MRIGAVESATGVPVSTLKYYIREGLLPPGTLTSPNQATYDDRHVERVSLIRALIDVGGLSTSEVKAVLAAVDNPKVPIFDAFAVSQDTLIRVPAAVEPDRRTAARRWVDGFIARHGFTVRDDAPARDALAASLERLEQFGLADLDDDDPDGEQYFDRFADFCRDLAATEMDLLPDASRGEIVAYGLLGTVLIDSVFSAIRRIADESAAAERFDSP